MTLIYRIIEFIFVIYYVLILANLLLSWRRNVGQVNTWVNLVYRLTDPYLNIFRRLLPPKAGSRFDFSPVLGIFVLWIIEELVLKAFLWLWSSLVL